MLGGQLFLLGCECFYKGINNTPKPSSLTYAGDELQRSTCFTDITGHSSLGLQVLR